MATTKKKRIFPYNNAFYVRVRPVKALLRSTTMYEVVTRGDFFAVNVETLELTVLPDGSDKKGQDG